MAPFSLPGQVLHTLCVGVTAPFFLPGQVLHTPYVGMTTLLPTGQMLHMLCVGVTVCEHDCPFLPTLPGPPPSSQSHRRRKLRGDA